MSMRFKEKITHHWPALLVAVIIGVICIAPQIVFRVQLGKGYQGIYLMQTDNEMDYLGRMQELVDGHWSLSSSMFAEYKDQPTIMPPNWLEFLIGLTSATTHIPVTVLVIASKAIIPPLLFMLIYWLMYVLLAQNNKWRIRQLVSIATGSLIVLGYDLIDYRTVIQYFAGQAAPSSFILWTRPFNPVSGAILIFLFLIALWYIVTKHNRRWIAICAGAVLALAISSYFFSWGMLFSVSAVLLGIRFVQKDLFFIKKLCVVMGIAILGALPYFLNIIKATHTEEYQLMATRIGFQLTHTPIINKFLLFGIIIFIFASWIRGWQWKKEIWWQFCCAFLGGSVIAFNQQIITGKTIWPFHFVQYSIPLVIITLGVTLYYFMVDRWPKILSMLMGMVMFAAIAFGIYVQAATYRTSVSLYTERQQYGHLFQWINDNVPKESVIFTEDEEFLGPALLVFTHANIYLSSLNISLVPRERLYDNYFLTLRLKGITAKEINQYLAQDAVGAIRLFGTEGILRGETSLFFQNIRQQLAADYKQFLEGDLKSEIKKYAVDYAIITKDSSSNIIKLFNGQQPAYKDSIVEVYSFSK